MINVLMIAPYPKDTGNIKGGVEAVTVNLVNGFKIIKGINLKVISIRKDACRKREVFISENICIQYIPFGRYDSTKLEMFFHGKKVVRQNLREFQPDIVHLQGTGSGQLLTVGMDKNNLLITQHGILHEEIKYQNKLRGKINLFLNILIEKACSPNIENYIFISNYNKNLFSDTKLSKIASRVIYNPVNPIFFNIENPIRPNRIIYVGSIIKRKGLLDLIKALNNLKKKNIMYELDVVGGFVEKEYENEIAKFIKNNNLFNFINFHEWLSQEMIGELYKKNPIFILPSYQETLPVSIAEALSANRIVISTQVGGIPEMINNRSTGLLYKKGDVQELEHLLELLHNNENLRTKLSKQAGIKARKRYHPEAVARDTYELYKMIHKKSNTNSTHNYFQIK